MYSILFNSIVIFGIYLVFLNYEKKNKIHFVFSAAFTLRLFFSVLNVLGIDFPGVNSTDISRFIQTAQQFQQAGLFANLDVTQSYVWSWVLGLVMTISRDRIFAPLAFNSFLGTLVVLSLYRTALILETRESAKTTAWLIALFPPLIFNSAILLRETIVVLLFSQLFYSMLKTFKCNDFSIKKLITIFVYFLLLVIFHGGFIIILLPIVFTMVYPFLIRQKKIFSVQALITFLLFPALLFAIIYYFFQLEIGHSKLYFIYSTSGFHDFLSSTLYFLGRRAQDSEMITWSTGGSLSVNIIELVIKTMFAPIYAGELRNYDMIRIILVLYVNICLAIILLKSILPSSVDRIGLAFILVSLVGFSAISMNYNHAFRHYMKIAPLLITLSTPTIHNFIRDVIKYQFSNGVQSCIIEDST